MVVSSVLIQQFGGEIGIHLNYSLWNRNETYLALFTLCTVGIIGMIDDYLNIQEIGRTK
jgi:UDP-N-acetylmuramyl pentapeptide phosphotransferase/UDP-N-acetylglucosamine-1-phosphate transferase